MTELSHGQMISLNYHLFNYPVNTSFKEICRMLRKGTNQVVAYDIFQVWDVLSLIEMMTDLANGIDKVIVDYHEAHSLVVNEAVATEAKQ